jgi:hypothetical protein
MCVYVCIQNTTAGIKCENTSYFYKVNDSIFGLNVYNYINAQTILFEYALNIAFNTVALPLTFRQPSTLTRSSIYIENLETNVPLYVGINEVDSGLVVYRDYEAIQFIFPSSVLTETNSYVIYVPIYLANAIVTSGTTTYKFISQVANKFNLSGLKYTIQTY